MFYKILLSFRNRAGSKTGKQKIQRAGSLLKGLLADGGGDDALLQHVQCGGDFVKGYDLQPAPRFFHRAAASVDAGRSEEQRLQLGAAFQKIPGEGIAPEFVVMIFQNLCNMDARIGGPECIFESF